jgi:hypothetical protein
VGAGPRPDNAAQGWGHSEGPDCFHGCRHGAAAVVVCQCARRATRTRAHADPGPAVVVHVARAEMLPAGDAGRMAAVVEEALRERAARLVPGAGATGPPRPRPGGRASSTGKGMIADQLPVNQTRNWNRDIGSGGWPPIVTCIKVCSN